MCVSRGFAYRSRAALEKRIPPALPERTEEENYAPYRSGPENLIPNLIHEILQPIEDVDKDSFDFNKLHHNIQLLGVSLRDGSFLSVEFKEGLHALLQILITPPVVKDFLSDTIKELVYGLGKLPFLNFDIRRPWKSVVKSQLHYEALAALASVVSKEGLELSDPIYSKDYDLTSMAIEALKVLRKMPLYVIGRHQIAYDAIPMSHARTLLKAFSDLLGKDHPEIKKTRDFIGRVETDDDDENP